MKVLIIEDNHNNLKVMKKIFNKAGHEVQTAFAGYEVKKIVDSIYVPDAIVLDLHIPEMGVSELLSTLTNRWQDVNIYIHSGYNCTLSMPKNVRGCFQKGASATQEIIKAIDDMRSE